MSDSWEDRSLVAGKHVHEWVDAEVGCADCGSHPAVRCTDPQCDSEPIDLIYKDDPREVSRDPHL